jgi:hypothetical protein
LSPSPSISYRLVDPYNNPTLYVRRPGDDHEEVHKFTDDDPFYSEVSNFIDAIEGGPEPSILSSYEDATKTYELTWGASLLSLTPVPYFFPTRFGIKAVRTLTPMMLSSFFPSAIRNASEASSSRVNKPAQ